jgi:hypothetical protein
MESCLIVTQTNTGRISSLKLTRPFKEYLVDEIKEKIAINDEIPF